ncbi:DUF305 domain-containing protein [Microcoleus sp. FACHB-1515]|uniref:DUF305 domain-containing protein n=1 Tax=Cyanophyceae TaxID=3028117 RepID=UPI001687B33E|nr:DUF305 domain-containing protein [Microcoleus sp. FACHB-1515]MBD2093211.1 DUF305 domain-containing protein [Microcoleus sp. FACHB-1515]
MKLRNPLLAIVFTGALALTACAGQSTTQSTTEGQSPTTETAQSPGMSSMPGMNHGGQSPMAGMDHGSMGSMSMDLGPKNETFDLRFIDGMIPHHEGAVVMAQEALQKSNRPEIKQLAQEIIDAQEREIAELKSWRQSWYPDAPTEPVMFDAQMGHDMPMSQEMEASMRMEGSLGAADDQFDLRFINAMVPHHEGAVTMAQQALQNSDRPEIKQLAQSIIDSQQQEINQMKQWKQQWYNQ